MNLLDKLKEIEPNISQIARDAEVVRQAVYKWSNGRVPRPHVFNKLANSAKYKAALSGFNYEEERNKTPLGRRALD